METKKILFAWAEAMEIMPILKRISFREAVELLVEFKDNPDDELADCIDSAFVEFETTDLEIAAGLIEG